jgi:hypothetical protein
MPAHARRSLAQVLGFDKKGFMTGIYTVLAITYGGAAIGAIAGLPPVALYVILGFVLTAAVVVLLVRDNDRQQQLQAIRDEASDNRKEFLAAHEATHQELRVALEASARDRDAQAGRMARLEADAGRRLSQLEEATVRTAGLLGQPGDAATLARIDSRWDELTAAIRRIQGD